ncbi:MAG: hypothetical protein R3357_03825 [Burkholderiales bacterium]|nr:hypothetical protein [Burkholderiales bacterium]
MRWMTIVIAPRFWLAAAGAALLAGCVPYAHYDGSTLVPGTSSEADIVKLMGPPAETVQLDKGAAVWFYPMPAARQTYAVTIGADGRFVSSEQRLQREYFDRIRRETWTTKEVRALLGPPIEFVRFERQARDVWTYRWREYGEYWGLHVQFSYDGVVREVLQIQEHVGTGPWPSWGN